LAAAETWADLDNALLNKILDAIDFGLKDDKGRPTGERYTAPQPPRIGPLVVPEPYDSDKDRKPRSGLRVDATKRPGTTETYT
jgi:hypothetical protein